MDGLAYQEQGARRIVKALFDTNILIDYLNAVPEARAELSLYAEKAISIITWMEVMVGGRGKVSRRRRAEFLGGFELDRPRRARRRAGGRTAPAAQDQTAGRGDLGVGAGPRHAFGDAQRQGFPAGDPGVRAPYVL